jgi:hypothetical protein
MKKTFQEQLTKVAPSLGFDVKKSNSNSKQGNPNRKPVFPDGHLKIPHLWPGQNPPPQGRQNGW